MPSGTTRLNLVTAHGAFPDCIVIGDEQSFFHQPTIVPLPAVSGIDTCTVTC